MENVNIRLARWEIAHFANHKHPHVSLQHKGVLGNWSGPEAGDTSDTFRSSTPNPFGQGIGGGVDGAPARLWARGCPTTWDPEELCFREGLDVDGEGQMV